MSTKASVPFAQLCIISDGETVDKIELNQQNYTIGREEGDILFDEELMSARHMQLLWSGNGFALIDLMSTNGTRVNGEKIAKTKLSHGDVIEVGELKLTYDRIQESAPEKMDSAHQNHSEKTLAEDLMGLLPLPTEPQDMPAPVQELIQALSHLAWSQLKCNAVLEAIDDSGQPLPQFVPFHVFQFETILGRTSAWAPLAEDEEASRRHALLRVLWNGDVSIEDLGSRNGTKVNGVTLLPGPVKLMNRDVVQMGLTTFCVRIQKEAV